MNNKLYPAVTENYTIIKQDGDSIIHMNAEYDISILEKTSYQYETMNSTAAELLSLCTGEKTIDHLSGLMATRYEESEDKAYSFVSEFMNQCVEKGYVELFEKPTKSKAQFYGDFTLVTPIFAAIEVTKKCPLRCQHCFNDSGISKVKEMSLPEINEVFNTLKQIGVQKIQLTGGEPTAREDFTEVLQHAVKCFTAVLLATNGYYITPEIARIIADNKNNIVVQVSVDGSEDNHDRFRAVKGSYRKAIDAIKLLSSKGVVVIISTAVSDQNFEDLDDLPSLAIKLGATQLTISPTVEQGRAIDSSLLDKVTFGDIYEKTKQLYDKYSGNGLYISYEEDAPGNEVRSEYCGAGKTVIAVRENGDVSPCVAYTDSYGNLLRDRVEDIFSSRNAKMFENIPRPSEAICGDCELLKQKCLNCSARAYDTSTYVDDCDWKNTYNDYMKSIEV